MGTQLELAHAVISVRNTARFADALSILFENRVSGVAVLAQSKLVGNISASDLRVRSTTHNPIECGLIDSIAGRVRAWCRDLAGPTSTSPCSTALSSRCSTRSALYAKTQSTEVQPPP